MWGKARKRTMAFLLIVCLALGNPAAICTYSMTLEVTDDLQTEENRSTRHNGGNQ